MAFRTTERHECRLASGGVSSRRQAQPGGALAVGVATHGDRQYRREHDRSASEHDTTSFRSDTPTFPLNPRASRVKPPDSPLLHELIRAYNSDQRRCFMPLN